MKQNLLFLKIQKHSKRTFIAVFCFVANVVFAQNPLLLSNPFPGSGGRSIQEIVSTQAGKTFYNTVDNNNPFSSLWGLWVTDGTPSGTMKMKLTSPSIPGGQGPFLSTEATMLTQLGNNKIIFAGDNESGYGEVWVSDGTQPGTFVLEQFISGGSGGPVANGTSFGNSVIYSVITNDLKLQLHKTDGTIPGTSLIYDFGQYTNYGIGNFKTIGNTIYFELINTTTTHYEMWRTDGTPAGTYQVKDLGQDYILESDFMAFNNNIYFITNSSTYGDYIWKSDGTNAGTAPLKQISTTRTYDNIFPSYSATSNALYFAANNNINGNELWKTDGTAAGTFMLSDINPGSATSSPKYFVTLNDVLYFSASDGKNGRRLWKYDVNSGGVPVIVSGAAGNPNFLTLQNNTILFSATSSLGVTGLWVSDGTAGNTVQITKINPVLTGYPNQTLVTVSGNSAYFIGPFDFNGDGLNDPCIYKYTVPQKIWTGSVSTDPSDANNWFPTGGPSQTDNVLISPSSVNSMVSPSFFCNDLINNGGEIIMQNGLILMDGNFYNEGVVDNSVPGVFGVVGNTNRYHSIGSPGNFVGQFTASSNVIMNLTANTKFNALRIEGADTIYLGDYQLTVDNYPIYTPTYITNGFGKLFLPVGSTPVTFSLTNPVTITNNGAPDYFGVSVSNAVLKNGFNGDTVRTQVVNKTWDIVKQTGGPANVNITLQWNAADELPGFVRNNVYLNHYINGAWDNGTPGVASGSGPFTFSRTGITSFSPFTVSSSTSALPVNLVSFTANKINNAVQLNWQTVSEKNFSFFAVERSADGMIFSSLGEVPVSFNNSTTKNYSYTDGSPIAGTNFYRLKMVDADGKFTYSKIVAVKNDNNNSFKIFPNPANDILYVQISGSNDFTTLQIFDAGGRKLKEEKVVLNSNTSHSINIKNLPKGVYNLFLKSKTINEHQTFVKQ